MAEKNTDSFGVGVENLYLCLEEFSAFTEQNIMGTTCRNTWESSLKSHLSSEDSGPCKVQRLTREDVKYFWVERTA